MSRKVFYKAIMGTGQKVHVKKPRKNTKLLFHSSTSLWEFQELKKKKWTFLGNSFPEVNISVELSKDKAQALKDYQENGATYQESHPRQSSKYTTLCLETILFSELSRYNRQAGISGRTMDAGSCHVLLTNSFWEPPSPRVSTDSTTPQLHTSTIPHVTKTTSSNSKIFV